MLQSCLTKYKAINETTVVHAAGSDNRLNNDINNNG
jgi:hypothetical protein